MKSILLIMMSAILYSCNTSRNVTLNYYYIEPFKEQEVKLFLNYDSTFTFEDLTGCNQFKFTGRYKRIIDSAISYFVFDSVEFKKILTNLNSDLIFSLKSGDTAWIFNKERIFINKQTFKATSNKNLNLQNIRYKELEEYYTNLLGREGFIKVFGNGKGKKEAKRRLLDCKLPDISIK